VIYNVQCNQYKQEMDETSKRMKKNPLNSLIEYTLSE